MAELITISIPEFEKCKSFAQEVANKQRKHRSGGTQVRSEEKIRDHTLQGKVAEIAVKKFLDLDEISLDFDIYPRGEWDNGDITINGTTISIKSSKKGAEYLLLEKKDVDRGQIYDVYIFTTVSGRSCYIHGFTTKKELKNRKDFDILEEGDCIPGTDTELDASNYGKHIDDLWSEGWYAVRRLISSN